jgi:hypothetical protein
LEFDLVLKTTSIIISNQQYTDSLQKKHTQNYLSAMSFQFEEVDPDDEPTTWQEVDYLEPKYQVNIYRFARFTASRDVDCSLVTQIIGIPDSRCWSG